LEKEWKDKGMTQNDIEENREYQPIAPPTNTVTINKGATK